MARDNIVVPANPSSPSEPAAQPQSQTASAQVVTPSKETGRAPGYGTGGLRGLQESADDMAQRLAFEVNTERAPKEAITAIKALGPDGLASLVDEAKAAEGDAARDDNGQPIWQLIDFLRGKYPAPRIVINEQRVIVQ